VGEGMTHTINITTKDDLTLEFILASKTLEPFNNVLGVYKHHYGDYPHSISLDALVEILSPIVQSSKRIQLEKVLSELLKPNHWKWHFGGLDDTPVNEVIVRYLIRELSHLPRETFFDVVDSENDNTLKELILNFALPKMKYLNESHF
jgi:hypothetical protein